MHETAENPPSAPLRAEEGLVTMVNTLTVAPEQQQRRIDLVNELTDAVLRHRPGFVSSRVPASLDRTGVVHCTQWLRAEDYLAALEDRTVGVRARRVVELAEDFDSNLYRVVFRCDGAETRRAVR